MELRQAVIRLSGRYPENVIESKLDHFSKIITGVMNLASASGNTNFVQELWYHLRGGVC